MSLVETVAAAGVLSLIVIFVLGLIPSFKLANRRASLELQAGYLAQSHLDQLRLMAFDEVAGATFEDVTVDGVTFHSSVTESDVASHDSRKLASTVKVEVSWEWRGESRKAFRQTRLCRILRS